MKKTLLTIAATTGIAVAGLAGVASAQSYGESDSAPATSSVEASGDDVVGLQATESTESTESTDDGEGRGRRGGCNLEAAAEAIGISEDELRAALDEGQSIAEVATAEGVDPSEVVDAMVAAKAERLAEKVADGRLTQEEADEHLAEETSEIEARVAGDEDAAS